MLTIRLQRTGRKGHAQFRVLVQDSRWAPTSGKFVALLGNYDPHTKQLNVVKEKTELYLQNGAQPSERMARLLKSEGVKLPKWVAKPAKKKAAIRNVEKLRKNRPAGAEAPPTKAEKASEAQSSTDGTSGAEKAEAAEEKATTEATTETEVSAEEVPTVKEKTEVAPAEVPDEKPTE